jgi:hypothetical protein
MRREYNLRPGPKALKATENEKKIIKKYSMGASGVLNCLYDAIHCTLSNLT